MNAALFPIHFQQCMFGGSRGFLGHLLTNEAQMSALAKTCDRNHHFTSSSAPKGKAAYTPELCDAIADIICKCASKRGVISRHTRLRRFARPTHQRFERRKQATSREATYSRRSFLNLKYTTEISWPIGLALPSNEKRVLTTVEADILQLPRGSKILPLERGRPRPRT